MSRRAIARRVEEEQLSLLYESTETFYLVDNKAGEIEGVPVETLCYKINREKLPVNIVIKRNLYVIVQRTECMFFIYFVLTGILGTRWKGKKSTSLC